MEGTEFKEGREAYSDDKNPEDNPYSEDPQRNDWDRGWHYAERNDPLFEPLD